MAVTNDQLAERLDSIDTRLTNVESILMSGPRNGAVSPLALLLIKWVCFPLILITGGVVGVTKLIPVG